MNKKVKLKLKPRPYQYRAKEIAIKQQFSS